jgi:DNA-binding beta-propeller fold protein YncE
VAAFMDDAAATFSRNAMTGALSFVEVDKDGDGGVVDGLDSASGAAVSPDGAHVYVAGGNDDAVATFTRNTMTGALSFVEVDKDGDGGVVDGLDNSTATAVSPDGAHVYVASLGDDAVATFSRNAMTGALSFVEVDKDGDGAVVDGLDGAIATNVSRDGAHVYVAGDTDDAIATFSREGMSAGGGGTVATPSNVFTIGRLRGKKLTLNVSSIGLAEVTDAGAQAAGNSAIAAAKRLLKPSSASGGPGTIEVTLKLTQAAKRKLRQNGKVRVKARIIFTPNGGTPNTRTAKLKVKQKR